MQQDTDVNGTGPDRVPVGSQKDPVRRSRWERSLVQFQCQVFVASWTGVIRCQPPRELACMYPLMSTTQAVCSLE